jgi:hypothetical protein
MILNYFLRWTGLVLLGLLIYGQTFQHDFVFDDHMFITSNPFIRDFGQMHRIWHFFPMTRAVGFYTFAFNYLIGQLHPAGYHIFNFLIHLLAVGLIWALSDLLLRITQYLPSQDRFTREIPYIVAILFLVHPCQTQAVSYITQRFESMATVFYLGTVYCYLNARLSANLIKKSALFGLSVLLTLLGIFTKETVITIPAMLLASEWILFPALPSRAKRNNINFLIALIAGGTLLYLLLTILLREDIGIFLSSKISHSHDGDVLTPMKYFLTQMRVFLTFLRLLVLPIHQNVDYDFPASIGLFSPPLTLAGTCLICGIIFMVIKLRRNAPLIAFGLAWTLITFSINLAPREDVIFEHKLYLISFGFFLTSVVLLSKLIQDRRTLWRVLLCVITVLAFMSFQRNKVWANDFTLWNDTVQRSPHKARPYYNRGVEFYRQGKFDQAFSDFNTAIQLNAAYAKAYNDRSVIYARKGDLPHALSDLNKAIALNPNYTDAYTNRAFIYSQIKHAAQK